VELAVNAALDAPDRPASAVPRQVRPRLVRRLARASGRSLLYCAVLIPLGTAALIAVPMGQAREAATRWRSLRTRLLGAPAVPVRRPGSVAVLGHAVFSLLLGAAALVPLGIQVLMLLRGVLYGLVDRGPYDHSWGGPTRAGAWLAHFLVGVPMTAGGLAALVGIAAVHQRLTRSLDGERLAPWLIPVTGLIGLAGAVFVVAWTRQL
jgi:hypothetical protein